MAVSYVRDFSEYGNFGKYGESGKYLSNCQTFTNYVLLLQHMAAIHLLTYIA